MIPAALWEWHAAKQGGVNEGLKHTLMCRAKPAGLTAKIQIVPGCIAAHAPHHGGARAKVNRRPRLQGHL